MLEAETSTSSGVQSSSRHLVHVPAKAYIIFDNVPKPSAILGKIRGFNASTPPALQLSQEELADGGVLVSLLDMYSLATLLLWSALDMRFPKCKLLGSTVVEDLPDMQPYSFDPGIQQGGHSLGGTQSTRVVKAV